MVSLTLLPCVNLTVSRTVWDFDSQNFTNVDTEKNAYYYHTWSSLLIERAINNNENPRRYYMWWPLLMKDQNYINRVTNLRKWN